VNRPRPKGNPVQSGRETYGIVALDAEIRALQWFRSYQLAVRCRLATCAQYN
jgi:hypothetical protein